MFNFNVFRIATALSGMLAIVIAFGSVAYAQAGSDAPEGRGKLTGKVIVDPALGTVSNVAVKLYSLQSGCCDQCKQPPRRPCRECGCALVSARINITANGKFEADLRPGEYQVVTEIDGQFAGYDSLIEIQPNKEKKLGTLMFDAGRPFTEKNFRERQMKPE